MLCHAAERNQNVQRVGAPLLQNGAKVFGAVLFRKRQPQGVMK